MGRLRTIGFETLQGGIGSNSLEGLFGGAATSDTSFARSGSASLKCDSGAGLTALSTVSLGISAVVETYTRFYLNVTDLPDSTVNICQVFTSLVSDSTAIRMESTGAIHLFNTQGGTQIGSSSAPLTPGQWYRVELRCKADAVAANRSIELRLDGVTVASGLHTSVNTGFTQVRVGWANNPGASKVLHIDDMAINSATGATQNSWPGDGKVILLKPTGDSAVGTGWVDGDGAGTLFGSVDNTPPVGVATAADGTQIKNLTSTTTGNYDATMTTYAAAGLTATDTITLVQGVCDTGTKAAASRAGAIQIVSNPAQAVEDAMTFGNGSAQGTWPTNWAGVWGTAQVSPSVTLTTAPVLRVGKRVANVAEVSVDFMGIYVEYVQGLPIAALHPFMDSPNTNTLLRM